MIPLSKLFLSTFYQINAYNYVTAHKQKKNQSVISFCRVAYSTAARQQEDLGLMVRMDKVPVWGLYMFSHVLIYLNRMQIIPDAFLIA